MKPPFTLIRFCPYGSAPLTFLTQDDFTVIECNDAEVFKQTVESANVCIALIMHTVGEQISFDLCKRLHNHPKAGDIPIIFLSCSDNLEEKLLAYECGCDDYIDENLAEKEIAARIMRAVFNCIANKQLKNQMQLANEMALTALANTSDLGVNVQFLLDSNGCANLDELGLLFFQATKKYQIRCSLQMRSEYGVKNMEANGMAKDLEAQLLTQLQDKGRFFDFGCRTVINFGSVSILIKNMPVNDEKRYGELKDNVFALAQGLDERVKSLDAKRKLEQEKILLEKLSHGIKIIMQEVDDSFKKVIVDIATVVDDMAENLGVAIPAMDLHEEHEKALLEIMENGIIDAQRIFNSGLKIDERFLTIVDEMDKAFGSENVGAQDLDRMVASL